MNKVARIIFVALSGMALAACAHVGEGSAKASVSTNAAQAYTQDVIAIQQLLARYAFALDGRDGDAWAATFVEDGTFETIGRPPKLVGRQQIAQAIKNRNPQLKPFSVRHLTQNTVIQVDGDNATMRAYLLILSEGKIWGTGNYEDKLRRVNGQWLFAERRFTIDPAPAAP